MQKILHPKASDTTKNMHTLEYPTDSNPPSLNSIYTVLAVAAASSFAFIVARTTSANAAPVNVGDFLLGVSPRETGRRECVPSSSSSEESWAILNDFRRFARRTVFSCGVYRVKHTSFDSMPKFLTGIDYKIRLGAKGQCTSFSDLRQEICGCVGVFTGKPNMFQSFLYMTQYIAAIVNTSAVGRLPGSDWRSERMKSFAVISQLCAVIEHTILADVTPISLVKDLMMSTIEKLRTTTRARIVSSINSFLSSLLKGE